MRDITSAIVSSLNESMSTSTADLVQNEPDVNSEDPKKVSQCTVCSAFYAGEGSCPVCGGSGKAYSIIGECNDPDRNPKNLEEDDDESDTNTKKLNPDLASEAEVVVTEALRLLDTGDFKRFNEGYRPRIRKTSKNELEALVESNGTFATAKRKMTSRQKAAYDLAEKYVSSSRKMVAGSKKNEALKVKRLELMMKNESRSLKIAACKILERQGAKYDFNKFNEGINKYFANKNYAKLIERICEDDEFGTKSQEELTPDEISEVVSDVIKDTGLEVIGEDTDIDGDTSTTTVRVEDSDDREVRTSEIQDVLEDALGAPVDIVGPAESEGDPNLKDLSIIVNPDVNEDIDPDDPDSDNLDSEGDENEEKVESIRRRPRRRNEQFIKGTGDPALFALMLNSTSIGGSDTDSQFLANDDSLVSGSEDGAENKARTFSSLEDAQKYLNDNNLGDDYIPVSISVVESSEAPAGVDPKINESEDDCTYFERDGFYYCKKPTGEIVEVTEDEFNQHQ